MIGLDYILGLYNMDYATLARELGIKRQNVNMWVRKKQTIPIKHLSKLKEMFNLDVAYFQKDITDIDKLEIQKEKLKIELNPVVKMYDEQFLIGEINDISKVPIYGKEDINNIEKEIEKAKLVSKFKSIVDKVEGPLELDTHKLIIELLDKAPQEPLLHKTIEALSHYLGVFPSWVSLGPEQDAFEGELFDFFDENNM